MPESRFIVASAAVAVWTIAGCGGGGTSTTTAGSGSTSQSSTVVTGPCGFPRCDTIPVRSGALARCDESSYSDLVARTIDQLSLVGSGCDGDHLVLALRHRSGAAEVSDVEIAVYVAVAGDWQLITVG